jgi:hypothetical protein
MFKKEEWIIKHENLYPQMVEDHEKINKLMNKFLSEVKKINGDSISVGKILTDEITQFNKQYDLSYCYKLELMFRK